MQHIYTLTFILFCVSGFGQNYWTKKSSFDGGKRERGISFAIDSLGYFGTGEDTASIVHNDLWKYSPATDTWTQVASMPAVGRRNAVAFVVDGKGYVGTGIDASESWGGNKLKDFWQYDPVLNLWTQKADYPGAGGSGVYFATGFAVDSKGYICAGKIAASYYANDLWEYKPSSDSWLARAPFPGGTRYQHVSLVIGLKAYVGLGTDENVNQNDWWEYNPGTNLWTAKNDFPGSDRASAATFTLGSRGYVSCGSNGGFLDDTWEYDPYADFWALRADFPGGSRRNAGCFAINNKGYVGMGKGGSGIRQNFYEYTPILVIGTNDLENQTHSINVFPNPVGPETTVQLDDNQSVTRYIILSANGSVVAEGNPLSSSFKIYRNGISRGIYWLNLYGENGTLLGKKEIVFE